MLEAKIQQDDFVAQHCADGKQLDKSFLQKEGYLHKLSIKSKRNWKRRFFVLEGQLGKLSYYKMEPGELILKATQAHSFVLDVTR